MGNGCRPTTWDFVFFSRLPIHDSIWSYDITLTSWSVFGAIFSDVIDLNSGGRLGSTSVVSLSMSVREIPRWSVSFSTNPSWLQLSYCISLSRPLRSSSRWGSCRECSSSTKTVFSGSWLRSPVPSYAHSIYWVIFVGVRFLCCGRCSSWPVEF